MSVEQMYQEIILDHYREKHHAGLRDPFEAEVTHVNPSCGDEIMLRVHLDGDVVTDLLVTADGAEEFVSPRIATRHTHGTGCTLASAIAAGLAQGMSLRDSVVRARAYVRAAIAAAPGYGAGHGPLDHGVTVDPARIPG